MDEATRRTTAHSQRLPPQARRGEKSPPTAIPTAMADKTGGEKAKRLEKAGPAMSLGTAAPAKSLGTATAAMADMTLAEIGRQALRQEGWAEAIRKRAGEVSLLGRLFGWFEWLVWAKIHRDRALVLLASRELDLWDVFGGGLPKPEFAKEVLVAGVFQQGLAALVASDCPLRLNDGVIGDKNKRAQQEFG